MRRRILAYKESVSSIIPTANLIAYYRFNNNVLDSKNSYDGTWSGTSAYSTGKSGNAMSNIYNTANYVTIADTDAFSFTNGTVDIPFSISFYAYSIASQEQIIANKIGASSNREWLIDSFSTKMQFKLYNQDGGTSNFIGAEHTYTRTNDTWFHWVITYDASGTSSGIKIYKNAIESSNNISGGTYVKTANLSNPVVIGRFNDLALLPLNGRIDGLGFWNKELTQTEITEIYNTQNSGIEIF